MSFLLAHHDISFTVFGVLMHFDVPDELLEVQYDASEHMIVRFVNALRILLSQQTDPFVLEMAAKALG